MSNPMAQDEPVATDELVKRVKANDRRHKHISLLLDNNGVSERLILEALRTNTIVTSVKVVIVTRNNGIIESQIIESLVSLFAVNHTIKQLELVWDVFYCGEEQVATLFLMALSQLPTIALESLILPSLREALARYVATLLLQNHPSLTHLEFGSMNYDVFGIVMEAVHQNEHITSLVVQEWVQRETDIEAILPAGNSIEKLSLKLDSQDALAAFWQAIQRGNGGNLTSLDLSISYRIQGMPGMTDNFATLARLQDLTLRIDFGRSIRQAELEALHQALQHMDVPILNLHFTSYPFTENTALEFISMKSFLRFINPVPPNIHRLLFSVDNQRPYMNDTEDAPNMIATVFGNNTTLESLTLKGNKFTNDVVVSFASILPTMTGLSHLALDCQNVRPAGGTALLRAVKASPNLLQVDLKKWRQTHGIPAHIVDDIFYTCKVRSIRYTQLIANAPLSLYPRALSKLGKGEWFNVAFRVLRARCDVLIPSGKDSGGGGGISGKRKRDESSHRTS